MEINTDLIKRNFRGKTRRIIIPAILDVFKELEDYLPLTVRQVYYQLVVKFIIENCLNGYNALSKTLTTLRRLEIVPWEWVEDRSRRVTDKRGCTDAGTFARKVLNNFSLYDRCLVQNQEVYCEVWSEKDALSSIFENVIWKYCIRLVVCRGQVSSSFLKNYADRVEANKGRKPVILYYGDFDASGCRIPFAVKNNLKKWHGIDVDLRRIALNAEQVHSLNLPHSPDAMKLSDPNHKWFIQNYGNYAVELDSIHPKTLIEIIEDSIGNTLDVDDMIFQQDIQAREREKLKRLEARFKEILREEGL